MTLERDGSEVTSGKCGEYCKKKKSLALALRGSKCYCGDFYPPKADSISDSECNFPCPGYPLEACGSLDDDIYSIFNTGLELDVPEYEEEEETRDVDDQADTPWELSYYEAELWDNQNNTRDISLTFPAEEQAVLDSALPRIVAVRLKPAESVSIIRH